ncbi:MAG: glycoside hydrolase family 38 C-terminal domain-containing protein [Candidatus Cloacimonetes bacterium]|nr:glycoside hydrolase family 38 C-terminal domain-containing protein [Candidatus Cloacimonadota bacterium]
MHNEKIHLTRIKRLLERQKPLLIQDKQPLEACFSATGEEYLPLAPNTVWGQPWQTGWFRISGRIPESFAGKDYQLLFDCDGEACLLLDGVPHQGFTPKVDWYHKAAKNLLPLASICLPGEDFSLLIDASANDLFGAQKEEYRLRECALVTFDEALYHSLLDIALLLDLAESLPEKTVRRQRLIHGLDKVCDAWNTDQEKVKAILCDLLSAPAHASALTAFSVGHAHLDLAWLWPLSETRRKGARTFANALRLMERYPNYVFGASQAQLYQWIREDHPALYNQVKERLKQGRWEIQGASWVEFDTNLISAESIIRQFMYGKRFFESEFGHAPRVLWLPDCFGFSGNLPQFLKGCGVDWFVTQKLSWNETNAFPHHLFVWEGIDGTRVLAHQLPTNDYNFSNNPSSFLETEKRYAQSEVCDAFLNLYGIGDGGGGPTRDHIEYGLRQQNLEGVSKFRFASSAEFFAHLSGFDPERLPLAYGELYLEFHRGTYTTQAKMKENNTISERKLGEAEYLAVLSGVREYPQALREIWQDALLLQFHDILPGSSITPVYAEADQISVMNHDRIDAYVEEVLKTGLGLETDGKSKSCLAFNPCNQDLDEWHPFPCWYQKLVPQDAEGAELPWLDEGDFRMVRLRVPAWGCARIEFREVAHVSQPACNPASLTLENRYLKVLLTETGGISSMLDKATGRELLAAESNLLQLWEDEPNNWGAWDINHFYRSTQSQKVHSGRLDPETSFCLEGQFSRVTQELLIGQTQLWQRVELREDEPFLRIAHCLDWQEKHRMLRTHWHPDIHSGTAIFGIQNGVIRRSGKPANAWEEARFEVPAQRFADLSQPDRGCALICPTKFGWRVRDNEMELNLLRSPADVDPQADNHPHMYEYAFYPHIGDYAHSDVFAVAEKLAHELSVFSVQNCPSTIPPRLFELISDHVNLDTVKPAENGPGTVLRLHECKGQSGSAELLCARSYSQVRECDMLENPLPEEVFSAYPHQPLRLEFRPFETKTLLLREEV